MKRFPWIVGIALGLLAAALPLAAQPREALRRALEGLRPGEPQRFGSLTVIPLLDGAPSAPADCLSLEQALERGLLTIEEKNGGSVPEVWVSNRSGEPVFLMGGEILSGARQDRIVRRDALVAPRRRRLAVPVYCVEQGRWHFKSSSFASEKNLGTWKLRAKAKAGGPRGQGEVWAEVAKANQQAGVSSSTGAYQDAYRDQKVAQRVGELEQRLAGLPRREPRAVGAAVALGEELVSLDLFGSPSLFGELWPKILKSAALDALASEAQGGGRAAQKARGTLQELLDRLARADWQAVEAVDLGSALELRGAPRKSAEGWQADALLQGEALLHLCAFPGEGAAEEQAGTPGAPR